MSYREVVIWTCDNCGREQEEGDLLEPSDWYSSEADSVDLCFNCAEDACCRECGTQFSEILEDGVCEECVE